MPKSAGFKRKAKNAGVGVDFKKARHKVGKKLPKAQNDTDTNFKSRAISLPGQNVGEDKGAAVTQRNLTLKELLRQSGHYSQKVRLEALKGVVELLSERPEELKKETGPALQKLADRITDGERPVRTALKQLMAQQVLPAMSGRLSPFVPLLMAHVCSAMTHLDSGIRGDALGFLEMLTLAAPADVEAEFLFPALQHYADLLSPATRGRTVSSGSLTSLHQVMSSLERFLASCDSLSQPESEPQAASPGTSQGSHTLWVYKGEWTPHFRIRQVQKSLRQLAGGAGGSSVAESNPQEAVLSRLVGHLLAAWGECTSATMEDTSGDTAHAAMAAALKCMQAVLRRLHTESQGEAASCRAAVLARIGLDVPLRLPASKASPAKLQAIVQINLAGLQLLTSFLQQEAQAVLAEESGLVTQLLGYYVAVLERGEAIPLDADFADSMQQPPIPADVYAAILSGLESVLPAVSHEWQRQLMAAFTKLNDRVGPKSASKAACLRFVASIVGQPRRFGFANAPGGPFPVVLPEEVAAWLKGIPKVLWEVGSSRPESSRLCLQILLDAARYCPARGHVAEALLQLEPHLALFYCTKLPEGKAAKQKLQPQRLSQPKLLSPLSKLPLQVQEVAAHLLFYLPLSGMALSESVGMLVGMGSVADSVLAKMVEALHLKLAGEGAQEQLLRFAMAVLEAMSQPGPELAVAAVAATAATASGDPGALASVEGQLQAAMASGAPCQATALACLEAVLVRSQRGGGEAAAAQLPHGLLAALPAALSSAIAGGGKVGPEAADEGSAGVSILMTARGLLRALPTMWPELLRKLPEAASAASRSASQPISGSAQAPIAAAAASLVHLCNDGQLLQQLSSFEAELQQASRQLSQLGEEAGHATVQGQNCQAACQLLRATVLRLTGSI